MYFSSLQKNNGPSLHKLITVPFKILKLWKCKTLEWKNYTAPKQSMKSISKKLNSWNYDRDFMIFCKKQDKQCLLSKYHHPCYRAIIRSVRIFAGNFSCELSSCFLIPAFLIDCSSDVYCWRKQSRNRYAHANSQSTQPILGATNSLNLAWLFCKERPIVVAL